MFQNVYLMRHAEKSLFSMQKHKKTDDFPRLSSVLLSIGKCIRQVRKRIW
ncbi:hypothetical protein QSI_2947 [Clostridioides difficile P28]|nr:hypothetical protein QSI_2947 [Clostridioides difficile P28]